MENKETFQMTYSAQQQDEIQSIRKKYAPHEESKLEQLRALDARVNHKAASVSIAIGTLGTIIMGCGMSLSLSDFGTVLGAHGFMIGVLVGVLGIVILALAYPTYLRTLKKEREKIAPEILRLTDELMQ